MHFATLVIKWLNHNAVWCALCGWFSFAFTLANMRAVVRDKRRAVYNFQKLGDQYVGD